LDSTANRLLVTHNSPQAVTAMRNAGKTRLAYMYARESDVVAKGIKLEVVHS